MFLESTQQPPSLSLLLISGVSGTLKVLVYGFLTVVSWDFMSRNILFCCCVGSGTGAGDLSRSDNSHL